MGVANHSGVFLPLPMVGGKREWHCSALIVEITHCAAYLARHLGASLDGGAGEQGPLRAVAYTGPVHTNKQPSTSPAPTH